MSKEPLTIADDVIVGMAYVLRSKTGREIDRSDGQVGFIQGHGQIVPGLEEALYGLTVGDQKEVVVSPADGYGEYDEEDVQRVPRSALPTELTLSLGQGLRLRDRETGEEFRAYIIELDEDEVVLDYNHPLAGQTLHFEVRIMDLRPATPDELAQGFV
ncbi:MAG TPA: peptidylprolyl isomerase [Candidatus Sulfomarinibacteraceae bacterium]|nr:peptidylprolyl isomerase [Candidatus Sulfomarinibacteraceae bacterium]